MELEVQGGVVQVGLSRENPELLRTVTQQIHLRESPAIIFAKPCSYSKGENISFLMTRHDKITRLSSWYVDNVFDGKGLRVIRAV